MDLLPGSLPLESLLSGVMADSLQYPAPNHYAPSSYFAQTHHSHVPQLHSPQAPSRTDTAAQRKRPKYTRSKTGCLTCRAKKIKCDESKPNCLRCTHGQRECTWPEGLPARKKPAPRREPVLDSSSETRPSTAGSSGVSEASTPPTRDITPPKREPVELGVPPLASRRHSEPVLQLPVGNDISALRRQSIAPSVASSVGSSQGYPLHSNSHTQLLPAIPEMAASYSAHQQYHDTSYSMPSSQQFMQTPSLVLPRIASQREHLHSHTHSLRSPGPNSTSGQWPSPPLLPSIDPIEPFFPSVQERNLIRHYCDNALSIMMAFPFENPVLAANLQYVLSARSRGSDAAVESLRMALLGTAAVHQSFLLSRNGVCQGQGGADEFMQLAYSFRLKSKQLLYAACSTADGARSDAALGAAVAIVLIDIFSGGQSWAKILSLAKQLINMRGGPAVLLARSSHGKPGTVTGVSRARLFLEIVAVYELFGCLAKGQEPTLLSPIASSWWLDKANSDDQQSYVEKVFGMSRQFIPLLARVTAFVARVLDNQSKINELSPDGSPADSEDVNDARSLYNVAENWTHRSADVPARVRAGDRIYQNVVQIILLRDVLNLPPDDTLVQQHADAALTLCLECGETSMGVDLNWPVIIAGSQIFGPDRPRVLAIFEAFRNQCCYEIETAEHIVLQVWKRLDEKLPGADWRSVMRDLSLDVLIL